MLLSLALALGLSMALANSVPSGQAAVTDFYQSSMEANAGDKSRVAGLTFSVQDGGGATLLMSGGSLDGVTSWAGDRPTYIGPFPFMFGRVQTDTSGSLVGQSANQVANRLVFAGDLAVTVSRLSPALLLESGKTQLTLFAPDNSAVPADIAAVQMHLTGADETATFYEAMVRNAVTGGTVKPLRWAAPGPDGSIRTGVLGTQAQAGIPVSGVARTGSLAPASPSLPPLDQLGSRWLLLWYGADSVFVHSKTPFVHVDDYYHADTAYLIKPYWPVRQSAYQADVPILVVPSRNPSGLTVSGSGITLQFPAGPVKMALMPLFGAKPLKAADTERWLADFPASVKAQADGWAARLAEYPTDVAETVSQDAAADQIAYSEAVSFTQLRPGGTREAPLPAMLALAYDQGLPLSFSAPPVDTNLPTEFGPVMTVPGESYTWRMAGLGRYLSQDLLSVGPSNAKSAPLEAELVSEVDKILQAGHLAPYIYAFRGIGTAYFRDPSEVLFFLADTLPVLPPSKQEEVVAYLASERTRFAPETVGLLAFDANAGSSRVAWDTSQWLDGNYFNYDQPVPRDYWHIEIAEFWEDPLQSLFRAYGLSRYYQASQRNPQADGVLSFCQNALGRAQQGWAWDTLNWFWGKYVFTHWGHYVEFSNRSVNRSLAGIIGCLGLYDQAGQEAPGDAWRFYGRLAALRFAMVRYARFLAEVGIIGLPENPGVAQELLRWADYSKPENFTFQVQQLSQYGVDLSTGASLSWGFGTQQQTFRDMVPEVGRMLNDWGAGPDVKRFLDFYTLRQADWYRFRPPTAEGMEWRFSFPSDSYQLFMAYAWIANTPAETLGRYIDIPWMERGDLYYLHKIAETIKAYRGVSWGDSRTFLDVPQSHLYYREIEALYRAGYTAGCNTTPLMYCPEQTMNRAESSVFVERGIHNASYSPGTPASQVFADLPLDSWAAKWVNGLWEDHYTAGCGTNPLIYCPWQGHTRAEGCVFYMRMLNGADYQPPQPAQQTFADVPLDAWYAKWVEAGYRANLLQPCATTPALRFCPNDPLTRAQAAYMMVQAKGLALP
jgi:hypothetical protein